MKSSSLAEAILETADDLRRLGILDKPTHEKITIRHLGTLPLRTTEPISGEEIRTLRQRSNLSQGSICTLSQPHRGAMSRSWSAEPKQPKGPALILLNVIRRQRA